MAKRAHKLEVAQPPITLIALSSAVDRHRLAWLINQALSIGLRESAPLSPPRPQGMDHGFPCYLDATTCPGVSYHLVGNRHLGEVLVRELPMIDFLLRVEGPLPPPALKSLLQSLRAIGDVQAAIAIDPKHIKRLEPL